MAVPNEWLNGVEPLAAATVHEGADATTIAHISAAMSLKRISDRLDANTFDPSLEPDAPAWRRPAFRAVKEG